jgi:hypothetical protein
MAITIKKVSSKKELKTFIRFNYELYKENPYSVPDLYDDMLNTFSPKKNAAFEFCEAEYFLAYKDNKVVGRIAGIINKRANETWNKKEVRFGWIDFLDDIEISRALLDAVAQWGKSKGMDTIQGPLGFTDFDAEGMLVEGFDQLSTMATIYNYPYYPQHMEKLGFEKDADWVEYKIYIPDAIPDKHKRISDLIQRKFNLRVKKYTSGKKIAAEYGQAIFELMNEAYAPLYSFLIFKIVYGTDTTNNELRLLSSGKVNGQTIISIDLYPGIIRKKFLDHLHSFLCRKPSFLILIDTDADHHFVHKSQRSLHDRIMTDGKRIKGSRKYRSSHIF